MSQNNYYLKQLFIYLLFLICSYFIIQSYGYTMFDDGWRHLSMAFNKDIIQSWKELFIHSLYEEYDPWFMWHYLLFQTSLLVGEASTPIIINTLIYFLLTVWTYHVLNQFSHFNIYFRILIAIGLPLFTYRYFLLRPDVLSGLFILYLLLLRHYLATAFIAILYFPFYYVFWFYFAYLGLIKLICKEYKNVMVLFCIGLLGLLFHLSYDYDGYLKMMHHVLNNQHYIGQYAVSESKTFFIPDLLRQTLGTTKLLIILLLLVILIFYKVKPKNTLFQYTLLLIPMMLVQYRFFHLLEPLVLLVCIITIHKTYLYIEKYGLQHCINQINYFLETKTYFKTISKKHYIFFCFIVIFYIFIAQYLFNIKRYQVEHQLTKTVEQIVKDKSFQNKRILISTMDGFLYRAIYFNPSGKYLPNCSFGWVDFPPYFKEIYFKIFTNNKKLTKKEFFDFLKFNNFDILIINTKKSTNMGFTKDEIENIGYYFEKITKENLIFKHKNKKIKL